MKSRPLRRRYITFRAHAYVDDYEILKSMQPSLTPGSKSKVIFHDSPFVVVRIDQISLKHLREGCTFPIKLDCNGVELFSLFATGSLKKTREKIKAIRR